MSDLEALHSLYKWLALHGNRASDEDFNIVIATVLGAWLSGLPVRVPREHSRAAVHLLALMGSPVNGTLDKPRARA